MLRNEKDAVIAEVQQLLTDTENLFVSDYRGLTVEELAELRGKLRQSGAQLQGRQEHAGRHRRRQVWSRARSRSCWPARPPSPSAAKTWSAPPRLCRTSPRRIRSSRCAAALLDASLIDPDGVKALASLPSRDVLIAQVVGTMAAPMTGLVTVLQGTISGFVRALDQVAQQRAAAGEA